MSDERTVLRRRGLNAPAGSATTVVGLVIPLLSLLGSVGMMCSGANASTLVSHSPVAHVLVIAQLTRSPFPILDSRTSKKIDGAIKPSPVSQRPRAELGNVWVTVEGVIPFTDDMTISDARQRAKNEARRKAVEQAVGVFIKGSTIVYNSVLAEDLVQSVVRGLILEEKVLAEGLRDITIGPGEKGVFYTTTLKARVRPTSGAHRGTLAVQASLNKQRFSNNEEMEIQVIVPEPAYVYIFNVGGDDSVTVLFPNQVTPANRVMGQHPLQFPGVELQARGFHLRALLPPSKTRAVEKIKFIATRRPLDFGNKTFHEALFHVYTGQDTAIVRDLIVLLSQLDDDEWAELTIPYEIVSN